MTLAMILWGCSGDPSTDTDRTSTDTDTTSPTDTPTGDTGTTPTKVDPCTVPALSVGTGVEHYVPLGEGDPVTVVFGPQGGWHVDVGAEVFGTGQIVSLQSSLTLTAEERTVTTKLPPQTLGLVAEDPCGWSIFGVRAFLDDASFPGSAFDYVCDLDGQTAILELTLVDAANDIELTDQVEVTLTQDPEQKCDAKP
ncbi:MAG: hypothetical protein KTR31_04155 [Myxococcales bacterium]|nr:hypothetical protein [Myxococcales bacterium]